MAIRGLLAFDDNGDLVQIDPNTSTPNDPPESDIEPVTMRDLVVTGVVDDNLDLNDNDIADIGDIAINGKVSENVNFGGNDIENAGSVSIGSIDLDDTYHYAADDSELTTEIDNAVAGDVIYLGNNTYSQNRTISKQLKIVGTSSRFESGTHITGSWTLDDTVVVEQLSLNDDWQVNAQRCTFRNISSDSITITVSKERAVFYGINSPMTIIFENGTGGGVVDASTSVSVTDNDGSNVIGDIS